MTTIFPDAASGGGGGGTTFQNVAFNGTATTGTSSVIASLYFATAATLAVGSLAYLGVIAGAGTVTLTLEPSAGPPGAVATWTTAAALGSVALTGAPVTLPALGWYDVILTAGVGATAAARGLYLV